MVTPEGRLSFPALFVPKGMPGGGEAKFSATILIPKNGREAAEFLAKAKAAITAEVESRWPDKSKRPPALKMPIRDGDKAVFESGENTGGLKKDKYPEYAGCWVLSSQTKRKPSVIDTAGAQVFEESKVFAGCWVRLMVHFFAYSNVNVGVSCGLDNVLFVREDAAFGAGAEPPLSAFAAFLDNNAGGKAAPAGPAAGVMSDTEIFG